MTLAAGVGAALRERKRLREAPLRSMAVEGLSKEPRGTWNGPIDLDSGQLQGTGVREGRWVDGSLPVPLSQDKVVVVQSCKQQTCSLVLSLRHGCLPPAPAGPHVAKPSFWRKLEPRRRCLDSTRDDEVYVKVCKSGCNCKTL